MSIKIWESFAHDEDLAESGKLLERHFVGELPYYDAEVRMKHGSGEWVWVRDRGKVSSWTEVASPLMMFGTHTDVTVRKSAELQAIRLVDEKDQLLKEVHHRIKNSTNTIRSLLSLKANSSENETVREALQDASARLNAMQVVGRFPETHHVTVDIDAEAVSLNNRALPVLGMMLTERITNAFKHSFAPAADKADEKRIRVRAEKKDSRLELAFVAYGGMQPEPQQLEEGSGFRLRMVRTLVEQLNGSLSTKVDDGLRFELEFPVN